MVKLSPGSPRTSSKVAGLLGIIHGFGIPDPTDGFGRLGLPG